MDGTAPRKEVELKLELPSRSLPALKKIPLLRAVKADARRTTELSVYFDTDECKLPKRGLMLRVRRIGHRYVQTIKATDRRARGHCRRRGTAGRGQAG